MITSIKDMAIKEEEFEKKLLTVCTPLELCIYKIKLITDTQMLLTFDILSPWNKTHVKMQDKMFTRMTETFDTMKKKYGVKNKKD